MIDLVSGKVYPALGCCFGEFNLTILEAKMAYLVSQARLLSEEAHKASRLSRAKSILEWRREQRKSAENLIKSLPRKIHEAANSGKRYIFAMYLEREDGSHEDGALGNEINGLRGSAKIVRNWALAEGFSVSVEFSVGHCNDGHFWLRISW